jgi:hypothetical protein
MLATSASTEISLSAIVSAACVYCSAFAVSPAFSASDASTSACRALALSFSSSPILLLRRISACF